MDKCLFDGLGEERNFRNEGWKLSARRIIYRRGEGRVQIVRQRVCKKEKRKRNEKRGYDAILFKYDAEGNREEIINKARG